MNPVFAIVLLTGATCSSPIDHTERTTVAYQVPCAIVIRAPAANPFKVAQQPNEISTPPTRTVAKRPARCGGGKVVWLKKKKNGKRRYRCAT